MTFTQTVPAPYRLLRIKSVAHLILYGLLLAAPAARAYTACAEFGKSSSPLRIASGTPDAASLQGFSAELTRKLFARIGKSVTLLDLPFARCMKLVRDGDVDFAIGPYQDAERARSLVFSKPYRILTPQVFMRADSAVEIRTVDDLKRYRGCGLNGSSYLHYGLGAGQIDQGATSYAGLILKLKSGRCDYIVEELQIIWGTENGRYKDDPELRRNPVAGAVAPGRHFATVKGGRGEMLLPALNGKIEEMQQRDEIARLWKDTEGDRPF
jgi:ABC-type amino acid transport substrate-binding protein